MNKKITKQLIKRILVGVIFSVILPLFAKENIPSWIYDKNKEYSPELYITGLGSGKSKKLAKEDAIAEISRYLKTTVKSELNATTKAIADGEKTSFVRTFDENVVITSFINLNGVEYNKPYYLKKERSWYCIAYINRDVAWQQYFPNIENEKNLFYSFYNAAKNEAEPLIKLQFLKLSKENANQLLETLNQARLFHPKNEQRYNIDRNIIFSLPSLIEIEKKKCTVFIDVNDDYGNIISSSISKSLTEKGFTLVESKDKANYIAVVTIDNNIAGNSPLSICPSIDFKIIGKKETVYSFNQRLDKKIISYELENAKKKAFPELAEKLINQISEKIINIM